MAELHPLCGPGRRRSPRVPYSVSAIVNLTASSGTRQLSIPNRRSNPHSHSSISYSHSKHHSTYSSFSGTTTTAAMPQSLKGVGYLSIYVLHSASALPPWYLAFCRILETIWVVGFFSVHQNLKPVAQLDACKHQISMQISLGRLDLHKFRQLDWAGLLTFPKVDVQTRETDHTISPLTSHGNHELLSIRNNQVWTREANLFECIWTRQAQAADSEKCKPHHQPLS
jgi:hypothetical protein